jgi:nardilysin
LRVDAGADDQSFEGSSLYTLFGIEVLLTEKGYENVDQVLAAVFSALLMLKTTSIDQHEKSFNELKLLHDTSFDYREEKTSSDNTETLAVGMNYYEPQDIITGPEKYHSFDRTMVLKLIEILNAGKFNLTILTDKHDQYKSTEKWFGTEYEEIGE